MQRQRHTRRTPGPQSHGSSLSSAAPDWQVQSAAAAQSLADSENATKTVQLTTEQQTRVYLSHPMVTGDSVSGLPGAAPAIFAPTDVTEVATKHAETGNTVLLVAGTVIPVGGGIPAMAWANAMAAAD
jgi:hypothetical protein